MKRILFFLLLLSSFASAQVGSKYVVQNTFYGRDFGIVPDGSTNNTAAWKRAINAVSAVGGILKLPFGVIKADSFPIPAVAGASYTTIKIEGEGFPLYYFGTVGTGTLPTRGTVLWTTSTTAGAAVKVDALAGPTFSAINLEINNLEVRTYDNPSINGIDAGYASFFSSTNVFINTGVYNPEALQPTHSTAGLITPRIDNGAMIVLRNVTVCGYNDGILVNEHTDGDNITILSCYNGLNFQAANHASHFVRVGAYRNKYNVTFSGTHYFTIDQLNVEHADSATQTTLLTKWQLTWADVLDPSNYGHGDLLWNTVLGNTGNVNTFTQSGGTGVTASRIGSAAGASVFSVSGGRGVTTYPIDFTGYYTNQGHTIGGLQVQPYAADNQIIGSNMYYSTASSNWKYVTSTTGSAINMGSGAMYFNTFASGTAGGVPGVGAAFTPLFLDNTGAAKMGSISVGVYTWNVAPNAITFATSAVPTGGGSDSVLVFTNSSGVSTLKAVAQSSLGGGSVPGANTNVYYNNSGAAGADAGLTYNTSTGVVALTKSQNGSTTLNTVNTNSGTSASAALAVSATNITELLQYGANTTNYGAFVSGAGGLYSNGSKLVLMADNASGEVDFGAGSTPAVQHRMKTTGQFQNVNYGSGTFTGTATKYAAWDASGNLIEVKINLPEPVFVISGSSTVLTSSISNVVFTGTTNTCTLPTVTGNTGVRIKIKNKGSGNMTINCTASEKIYSTSQVASVTILPGGYSTFLADGTDWSQE